MTMNYVTKRTGQSRLRTEPAASVEVLSIIRTEPFHWVSVIQYTHGTTTWVESVQFVVLRDVGPGPRVVVVSDADNHGDREHVIVISDYDIRVMPQVIIDFFLNGRW